MIRIAKWLLVAEGIVLAARYLREHIYENVYEREIVRDEAVIGDSHQPGEPENLEGGEFYGIGFGTDDGSVFWFHKRTEHPDRQ